MVLKKSVDIREIESEIRGFERLYGVPSASLQSVYREDGELVETPEFHCWQSLYALYVRVTGDQRRVLV